VQPGRIQVLHGREKPWLAALAGQCLSHSICAMRRAQPRADLLAAKIGRVEIGQTGAAQDALGNYQS
jgi:hypothetical protein